MKEYKGATARIVSGIAIAAALYHFLFISGLADKIGIRLFLLPYRAGSLALVLLLVFLLYPGNKRAAKDRVYWYDILFMALGVGPSLIMLFFATQFIDQHTKFQYLPALIAFMPLLVAIIEGVRRTTGISVVLIVVVFFLYPVFQSYVPGVLGGKSFALPSFTSYLYTNLDVGIFGVAFGAAASIIIVFVIFSQFLITSGAGEFFMNLALSIIGHVRGGPAKVAVVGSGLFGTLTGSPSAEVAAVGSITIPMMKKIGYEPRFAAGVEAVAGNGGQIMPPVMGLVVFVMAEVTGIPYWKLALVSIFPAILYYAGLFVQIDIEAARLGLKGLPRQQLPSFWKTLQSGWTYLLPLAGLVVILIVLKFSPEISGLYATIILLIVSVFSRKGRLGLRKIAEALDNGARAFVMPAVMCAAVGVIIGSVVQTALGVKLSSVLIEISGQSMLALLALTAIACYVLGLGLSSIPLYIMMVVLTAPALTTMGVNILPAHLFVMWYGLTSFITPPEAVAVYVACAISGSGMWETGWVAMRLGIATYVVPFLFVYRPALLMIGTPAEVAVAMVISLVAITAIVLAVSRYFLKRLTLPESALLFAGGVLLIVPTTTLNLIGLAALAAITVVQLVGRMRERTAAAGGGAE